MFCRPNSRASYRDTFFIYHLAPSPVSGWGVGVWVWFCEAVVFPSPELRGSLTRCAAKDGTIQCWGNGGTLRPLVSCCNFFSRPLVVCAPIQLIWCAVLSFQFAPQCARMCVRLRSMCMCNVFVLFAVVLMRFAARFFCGILLSRESSPPHWGYFFS